MSSSKKHVSDTERLSLAARLDKELEEFISKLEKKQYTDGWPEDRWEEEMAKHPFFMTKPPEPGEEVHPLYEGMQALKFDPDENTQLELAENYKADGKFYMTHKKYRMAVMSYTEALKFKIEDDEFNAIIYNNRSAANFFLKNYRSSLNDAQKAVKLKPDYDKAQWRAAQCAGNLDKFDLCIETCDKILKRDPKNEQALDLRKTTVTRRTNKARDERKLAVQEKKKQEKIDRTLNALKNREIKFEEKNALKDIECLRPKLPPLEDSMVYVDDNDCLHWPTVFCYPEFLTTDFEQQLSELVTMDDCLHFLFQEPLEHDKENKYNPTSVNVYYENRLLGCVYKIDTQITIKEILQEKTFFVYNGTLTFFIVPKASNCEEEFINQPRRPLKRN